MATNDKKINLYHRRLLSLTSIKDNFLDYLVDSIRSLAQSMFIFSSGILDGDAIGINNSGGGNTFTLDLTNASKVLVANGEVIDLSQITGVGITESIPFENTASATYYIGIKHQEVPFGIEANASTGDPEYPSWKQTYGEKDYPDSVSDNTTYIRLIINSITESGVDHSGRTVRVWLVDPVSLVEGTAYYEGTVVYDAPNNYVDIPYSGASGPLGQDTSVDPPSTTNTDYEVFIEGATWKKNTDLSADSNYAYLGEGTGGTPPTFDPTVQDLLFTNSLDTSYDGPTGSGSGRRIIVDSGAIELVSSYMINDAHGAQLRLTRHGASKNCEMHLEVIGSKDQEGSFLVTLDPVKDPADTTLQDSDAVTLNAIDGRMDFTRGGVNLQDASLRIDNRLHVVLLEGTTSNDGLYIIDSFTASYILVGTRFGGYAPDSSWEEGATGTATILVPRFIAGQRHPVGSSGTPLDQLEYWRGCLLVATDGKQETLPVRHIPNVPSGSAADVVEYYDNFKDPGGFAPHSRIATKLVINDDGTQTWNFGDFGPVISGMNEERFVKAGVNFKTFVYGSGSADKHAVNVRPQDMTSAGQLKPQARSIGLFNTQGHEQYRWENCGRLAKPRAFFEDDINYRTVPTHIYSVFVSLGGDVAAMGGGSSYNRPGGMFRIYAGDDATVGCEVTLSGPSVVHAKPETGYSVDYNKWIYMAGRVAILEHETSPGAELHKVAYKIGLRAPSTSTEIGLVYGTVSETLDEWRFYSKQGASEEQSAGFMAPNVGSRYDDDAWVMFWFRFNLDSDLFYFSHNQSSEAQDNIADPTNADWRGPLMPFARVEQLGGTNVTKNLLLDYWCVWDEDIKSTNPD